MRLRTVARMRIPRGPSRFLWGTQPAHACRPLLPALFEPRPSLCVPKAPSQASHCRYPDLKGGGLISLFPVSSSLVGRRGGVFPPSIAFRQPSRLAQLAPSHAPRRVLARLRTAEQHAIEDGCADKDPVRTSDLPVGHLACPCVSPLAALLARAPTLSVCAEST